MERYRERERKSLDKLVEWENYIEGAEGQEESVCTPMGDIS